MPLAVDASLPLPPGKSSSLQFEKLCYKGVSMVLGTVDAQKTIAVLRITVLNITMTYS